MNSLFLIFNLFFLLLFIDGYGVVENNNTVKLIMVQIQTNMADLF